MDLILKYQIVLFDACETSFQKMRTYGTKVTHPPPIKTTIF